jgi:hypothetical protein
LDKAIIVDRMHGLIVIVVVMQVVVNARLVVEDVLVCSC